MTPGVVHEKNRHTMTLHVVCEKNRHAMTLVDPYVVCLEEYTCNDTSGSLCGSGKEQTCSDTGGSLCCLSRGTHMQ